MLSADSEWIVSGSDDSYGLYKSPEENFDVIRNNLVISPKAQLLRMYQNLFAHKQWESEAKQIFRWLDSERNGKLSGIELFDYVYLFAKIFGSVVDRHFDEEDNLDDEYFDLSSFGIRSSALTNRKVRACIVIKSILPLLKAVSKNSVSSLPRTMRWFQDKKFTPIGHFASTKSYLQTKTSSDYVNTVAGQLYRTFFPLCFFLFFFLSPSLSLSLFSRYVPRRTCNHFSSCVRELLDIHSIKFLGQMCTKRIGQGSGKKYTSSS